MATSGIGAGSLGTELLSASAGTSLGTNDRYTIVRQHHSTENTPFPYGHSTYIAVDQQTSQYVTLRILGKQASSQNEADSTLPIVKKLSSNQNAKETVLLPIDSFRVQDQYLVEVYELHGPELSYVTSALGPSDGAFPSSWVSKVIFDALQSLDFLHSNGVVHGSIAPWSLVITYPQLQSASREEIEAFFGQEDVDETVMFNETGTSSSDEPSSTEFTLKIQNFKRAFAAENGPSSALDNYIDELECPPPELVTKQQVSEKTDIWNLGIFFANILSATPEFDTLVGGRGGSSQERLARAEKLLGPIPAAYRPDGLPSLDESSVSDLYQAVKQNLDMMLDDNEEDEEESSPRDVFTEDELKVGVDLVRNMLAFDPQQRFSASQALNHPFFQNGGDDMEE